MLFAVSPTDPFVFAGVTAALLLTAAAATAAVPALQAAHMDPVSALKSE